MKNNFQRMNTQLGIISDLGFTLSKDAVIVDLGCGNCDLVNEYRKAGFNAYGCDFKFKESDFVTSLLALGIVKYIDLDNYKLPFENNSVDFLITDQVFEHVQDYPCTLAEIKRVLKPEGISLNFFPSRYVIIEPHVHVPFASIFQNYNWLKFWAILGIRTKRQKGLSATATASENLKYLKARTVYLKKSEIKDHCSYYFNKVRFSEDIFFKYMKRSSLLFPLSKIFFFLPALYSTVKTRVLFFGK